MAIALNFVSRILVEPRIPLPGEIEQARESLI